MEQAVVSKPEPGSEEGGQMASFEPHREQVRQTAMELVAEGLLMATGGNVSLRIDQGEGLVAITPSSKDYRELGADDICVVDFQGNPVEGAHVPSFETAMHIAVYRNRPDVNAVIHTHQSFASIYSLIGEGIPALFDEQVINLGNRVETVPYALSGSEELMRHITRAVGNRCNAYILQNHGCLVLGSDIAAAARNARLLEKTASVYYRALLLKKEISRLPADIEELLFGILKSQQEKGNEP